MPYPRRLGNACNSLLYRGLYSVVALEVPVGCSINFGYVYCVTWIMLWPLLSPKCVKLSNEISLEIEKRVAWEQLCVAIGNSLLLDTQSQKERCPNSDIFDHFEVLLTCIHCS